jgi:transposase-like protein
MDEMKTCRKCGETKELLDFVKNKQSKGGYTYTCKSCEKEWKQEYYSENKTHITNRNKEYRVVNGMWYNKSIEHRLRYVSQLGVIRAKKKNIEWNLSLEFLLLLWEKQQFMCAYSGVPLTFEDNHPHTVSLDRLDSSKGYTEDNVQYVCTIVNYIKQRFDENHFFDYCKLVAQNCK